MLETGADFTAAESAAVARTEASASRWKTLSRQDPEFLSYLDGSFSLTHVAMPVRSLNVGSPREEVTFEIVASESLEKPSVFKVAALLLRPATLALSLGPMLATLFFCLAQGWTVNPAIVASSLVGVLLFHAAVNLFNDYGDHMRGQDRIRALAAGATRAIQKGWVRAVSVKRAAWTLTVLAAACGLPAIVLHFAPVAIVAGLALLWALELAFQRLRLKYHGWAEIMAFALTGPLLTSGFAWAASSQVSFGAAALGCVFGSITLMYFHSSNFENIMADAQAGVRTWATRSGFDASQRFFYFTAALVFLCSLVFVAGFQRDTRLVPLVLAQAMFLVPVMLRVRGLASPLSSGLVGLRNEAVTLCWITSVAMIGGFAWLLRS